MPRPGEFVNSARPGAVWAVFVTWNPDPDRLFEAVASLRAQVEGVIVVDNGSDDVEQLAAHFASDERLTLVALGENRGVGAALNVGVRQALAHDPQWIVTMDQDTVVSDGAVAAILRDFAALDPDLARRCALLSLRPHPQPASIWLTRYAERLMELRDRGEFTERRGVITSGNLVRADVARDVPFNEAMFIDQVDFDFCYSLRRRGFVILRQRAMTTDHVLGQRHQDGGRVHPYENAQRFYYVVRNSTFMAVRRRLPVRYYVVQVVVMAGAFVSVNGVGSVPLATAIIARGVLDAWRGRMGRREYPLLQRGRR